MISGIKRFSLRHPLILLSTFFLFLRLPYLTKLPIFNDEAIYLDWGWRETHNPGFLFYSLYDAKQPLIMWAFGLSQELFSDTLLAGRLVSVLIGLLGALGLYKLLSQTINRQYALIGSLIYSLIPIFLFFDRQALMESAMVTVVFWGCFYTLEVIENQSFGSSAMLGVVYGLGFFSKSTALLFFLVSLLIILYSFVKERKTALTIRHLSLILLVFLGVCLLLLIQPEFWATLGSNSRYTLSLKELVNQSSLYWVDKASKNTLILFLSLTPIIVLTGIFGIYKSLKGKEDLLKRVVYIFAITFFLQFLFSRFATPRYLVTFMALFTPFIIFGYKSLTENLKRVFLISLIMPVTISLLSITYPIQYLNLIGFGVDEGYTRGQTSGIGVKEAGYYVQSLTKGKRAFVAMALNAGNPESGIIDFFQKDELIKTGFMDSQGLGDLSSIECLKAPIPLYYLTRNEEIGEFARYFKKIKTIHQPSGGYSIGIYQLNTECKGKKYYTKNY